MNKNKIMQSKRKQIVLIVMILGIIFPSVYLVFSTTLRTYLKDQISNEATLVAKSNSTTILSLDRSITSIHGILVDQLTNVADLLVSTSSPDNIERNDILAQNYLIDEINWFSTEGVIIYSSKNYEGISFDRTHAVWKIIDNDDLDLYVEDIRQDRYTDEEFLLLYMRASDNSVVQVGVLTTRIRELTDEFSIETLITNNLDNDRIISAFVYAPYQAIQISNVYDNSNLKIGDEQMDILLSREDTTRETTIDGHRVLEVYTTLYDENANHTGSFYLAYSLEETEAFVKQVTVFTFVFLLLITLLILFFMGVVFKQNRKIEQSTFIDPETNILNAEYIRSRYDYLVETNSTHDTTISLFLISNFRREQLLSTHQEIVDRLNTFIDVMKEYSESKEVYRYSEDVFLLVSHHWSEERVIQSLHDVVENDQSNFEFRTAIVENAAGFDSVDTLFETYKAAVLQLRENEDAQDLIMNTDIQERLMERKILERDMRLLSTEGFESQLHVEFQPQVNTITGTVIGYETLTRWIHPTFGYISPLLIFDIAQSTDYYNALNQWVITQALDFIRKLNLEGYHDPVVSVNTPNSYLLLPDFIHNITELMKKYQVSPHQLGLEITETTFEDSSNLLITRIQELNALGITTYIDDYGSGYSSMIRLRDLDVSVLKIDKTFVDDIDKDERFLHNILGIANELNLEIVAEGAEHDYQIEWLKNNNCSVIQGFYFSKSLVCEDALNYIRNFEFTQAGT